MVGSVPTAANAPAGVNPAANAAAGTPNPSPPKKSHYSIMIGGMIGSLTGSLMLAPLMPAGIGFVGSVVGFLAGAYLGSTFEKKGDAPVSDAAAQAPASTPAAKKEPNAQTMGQQRTPNAAAPGAAANADATKKPEDVLNTKQADAIRNNITKPQPEAPKSQQQDASELPANAQAGVDRMRARVANGRANAVAKLAGAKGELPAALGVDKISGIRLQVTDLGDTSVAPERSNLAVTKQLPNRTNAPTLS